MEIRFIYLKEKKKSDFSNTNIHLRKKKNFFQIAASTSLVFVVQLPSGSTLGARAPCRQQQPAGLVQGQCPWGGHREGWHGGGYKCLCPTAGPRTWKRADRVASISLSICKYLQLSYYKLLV